MLALRRTHYLFILSTIVLFGAGLTTLLLITVTSPSTIYAQSEPVVDAPITDDSIIDDVGTNHDDTPLQAADVTGPDIRGGHEAEPGAWPWQVALIASYYTNAYAGQFCGGSLVHPEWVLTAAHCVIYEVPEDIDVVLGRHQLSLDDGERISITHIVIYPEYESAFVGGDLALLHLSRPTTQTVVSLDADIVELAENRSLNATVTGWGATDNSYYSSDVLREVTLPFVSLETCRDAYYYDSIPDSMVCAGYEKGAKSACYGDSGGPLMIPSETESGWTQVGIVSWGRGGCSGEDNYNVYTRVATYSQWIEECVSLPASNECIQGDAFEPDDSPETATLITTDSISQTHNFHSSEDRDWLQFEAEAGVLYHIETLALSTRSDTILWIYGSDGVTALSYNDDHTSFGRSSRLQWKAPRTGTYYIQVDNHWQSLPSSTQYSIIVMRVAEQLYLPLIHQSLFQAVDMIEVPAEEAPPAAPTSTPTLIPVPTATPIP